MKKSFFGLLFFLTTICYGQINLEHTYNDGNVSRVLLENSGEKYYVTDLTNKQVKIYNSDHSFWKTINLPTTTGATINAVYHLSETKISTDNLIEVIYTYYVNNGGNLEWESRVINENGTTLLNVIGASSLFLSELQGASNKLIAYIYGTTPSSKIYSVPSLNLEHSYPDGNVSRTKLENSGEKYYVTDLTNKQVKIYNSDHSFWKTINLPTTTGATLNAVYHLSETKISTDNLIEVIYTYYVNNSGNLEWESRVINENGTTLLTVVGASSLFFSELQGLPNKLIAYIYGTTPSSKVYGLPTVGPSGIKKVIQENQVKIFPNPTSDILYITSDFDIVIDNIKIYNVEGKCVFELSQYSNQPINVSKLNKGIYIISGHRDSDMLFHSKFIVE